MQWLLEIWTSWGKPFGQVAFVGKKLLYQRMKNKINCRSKTTEAKCIITTLSLLSPIGVIHLFLPYIDAEDGHLTNQCCVGFQQNMLFKLPITSCSYRLFSLTCPQLPIESLYCFLKLRVTVQSRQLKGNFQLIINSSTSEGCGRKLGQPVETHKHRDIADPQAPEIRIKSLPPELLGTITNCCTSVPHIHCHWHLFYSPHPSSFSLNIPCPGNFTLFLLAEMLPDQLSSYSIYWVYFIITAYIFFLLFPFLINLSHSAHYS